MTNRKPLRYFLCFLFPLLLSTTVLGQTKYHSPELKTAIILFEDSCDYQKSLRFCREAKKSAIARHNIEEIVLADLYTGKNYINIDEKKAAFYLQRARKNCEAYQQVHLVTLIDLAFANLYVDIGENDSASALLFRTLDFFKRQKDYYNMGNTYVGITKLYYFEKNADLALKYNEKARAIYHELNEKPKEANTEMRKLFILITSRETPDAIQLLQEAYEKYPSLHHGYGKFQYLNNCSLLYSSKGDLETALRYTMQARRSGRELGILATELDMIRRIGLTYQYMGEMAQALKMADTLELCAKDYRNTITDYYNFQFIAQLNAAAGNYEKAYEYQEKSAIEKEKMTSETLSQKIKMLETKRANEEKDRKIRDLSRDKEFSIYRFYFFIVVIVLLLLMIFIAVNYYKFRLKREKTQAEHIKEVIELEASKKIKALEIQILYAQMNPHFVFNCLSAIQHLFLSGDRQNGNAKLNRFAHLLRLSIDHVKNDYVSLRQELKFLKYYIDMEQLQFNSPFNFKLTNKCEVDLDELLIPSMILQPFVENAINHGLKHRKENGKLSITVNESDETIEVIIEDNGVGRIVAAEIKAKSRFNHNSRGLSLVQEKISSLEELYGDSVQLKTTDLIDSDSKSIGTRVSILFLKKISE